MQPETLEIIDQVVTAGDAPKKVVDLGGARCAGREKNIAHAWSLAVAHQRGKAQKFQATANGSGGTTQFRRNRRRNLFAAGRGFASVQQPQMKMILMHSKLAIDL